MLSMNSIIPLLTIIPLSSYELADLLGNSVADLLGGFHFLLSTYLIYLLYIPNCFRPHPYLSDHSQSISDCYGVDYVESTSNITGPLINWSSVRSPWFFGLNRINHAVSASGVRPGSWKYISVAFFRKESIAPILSRSQLPIPIFFYSLYHCIFLIITQWSYQWSFLSDLCRSSAPGAAIWILATSRGLTSPGVAIWVLATSRVRPFLTSQSKIPCHID